MRFLTFADATFFKLMIMTRDQAKDQILNELNHEFWEASKIRSICNKLIYTRYPIAQQVKHAAPFDVLLNLAADVCNVNESQILSKSRETNVLYARYLIINYLRVYAKCSSTYIGALVKRNHATVLHAVDEVDNLLDTKNPRFTECFINFHNGLSDLDYRAYDGNL